MSESSWVLLVAVLVASSSGLMGSFLVLRRLSMVGDAISHTVLLGVIVAFLVTRSMGSGAMLLGAALAGLLTVLLIQWLEGQEVTSDAAIGVVFTSLFALGVLLVSHYAKAVHIDLQHVLFGEIAYVPWDRFYWHGIDLGPRAVWTVGGVTLLDLLLVLFCYRELQLLAFDSLFARQAGVPVTSLHHLYMLLLSLTVVVAFDAVGAILAVAMLVIPPATAHLLADRLPPFLGLSVTVGAIGAVLGYVFAAWKDVSVSGMMSVVTGGCFALAVLLAPRHGVWARRRQSQREFSAGGRALDRDP
ncbi:metal ABC transporter permease [Desulfothermobacter acidiphilus]|uniref:metal ABC transporter permease n=1 Tax=Desulfothermobacter acidiphilus TaxID=1938353 RepID=UPI003F891A1A